MPPEWGAGFPLLRQLNVSFNQLNGTLPDSWGQAGALPALRLLDLSSNQLAGGFPGAWSQAGAFPQLVNL